ncbi:hypothetical protein FOA52_001929 [Chlamydomonas sp. UWO 241]|nr:hypothetical protein FOA52_001929 [Chlamydomonas sp. UWO 241]
MMLLAMALVSVLAHASAAPCSWYDAPMESSYYGGGCGTTDEFTLKMKAGDLGQSSIAKFMFDSITANSACETTLFDDDGCRAATPENGCYWAYSGVCQAPALYTISNSVACPGSFASEYYDCIVNHRTEALCATSEYCVWRPDLSRWNDDGQSVSCYHVDVPGDAEGFDDWFLDSIGAQERDTYMAVWGDCATATDYYSANAYSARCLSAQTRSECDAANCWWDSAPAHKDRCAVDPSIRYGYMLRRGGLLMDQFLQCFNPLLTMRGKEACEGHKIVF